MALETASYVANLVETNPDGGDARSTADDHLRLLKAALKRTFPLMDSAVSVSAGVVHYSKDLSASVQLQLNQLRDGTATAANAINARYALTATSASSAATLENLAAAAFAQLASANVFANRNNAFVTDGSQGIQVGHSGVGYGAFGCNVQYTSTDGVYKYLANDAAFLFQFHLSGVTFYHAGAGTGGNTISFSTVFQTNAGVISGNITTANSASYATNASVATSAATAAFASTATSASSAATLSGLLPADVATANTIAQRDSSGDLLARYLRQTATLDNQSVGHVACMTNLDSFWRVMSLAQLGAYLEARNITGRTGVAKTLSASTPSGGSNGDIWYRY